MFALETLFNPAQKTRLAGAIPRRVSCRAYDAPLSAGEWAALSYAAGVYGLRFYETETGVAAAGAQYTAEVLPEDAQGGEPFAMVKWLNGKRPLNHAYLGFALE